MSDTLRGGLIEGLDQEEYHKDPALGSSDLRALLRSPAHFQLARSESASTETEAKTRGSLIHCAILEPEALPERYVAAPECDRRTKDGKAIWAAAVASAGERELVPSGLWETGQRVLERALRTPAIQAALAEGKPEVSLFGQDPVFPSLRVKARADWYAPNLGKNGMILDLKTTRSAFARDFVGTIFRYGYHVQAAHYRLVAQAVTGKFPAFVIVAVETAPPYGIALFELDAHFLEKGREDARQAKLIYLGLAGTALPWPCYPERVVTLSMPTWRMFDGTEFGTFGDDDSGGPFALPGIRD